MSVVTVLPSPPVMASVLVLPPDEPPDPELEFDDELLSELLFLFTTPKITPRTTAMTRQTPAATATHIHRFFLAAGAAYAARFSAK